MVGSRLERIGTIFTRMTGLLQSHAVALEDRPIWYDVYKAFPPAVPPRYDRPGFAKPPRSILYPEDVIRAKFHKQMDRMTPMIDLSDEVNLTITQKLVLMCNEFQKQKQMSLDDAYKCAFDILKAEGLLDRQSKKKQWQEQSNINDSLSSSFKWVSSKPKEKSELNLKDIFIEDK
ncbi:mitochondrial ribosomal protein S23 [Lycorma delicatula]|uniref:mitochondrial ribosomal protein S23 n=1 Tax=Lycorma delicatula TaxID=130591 RepID=UPI003F511884